MQAGKGSLQVATEVAKALEVNTTLTSLNLEKSQVGDEGGVAIAKALGVNTSLIKLNLRNCSIGYEGCTALGKAFEVNNTMVDICLMDNQIDADGRIAFAFTKALGVNTSLTKVDLQGNHASIGQSKDEFHKLFHDLGIASDRLNLFDDSWYPSGQEREDRWY